MSTFEPGTRKRTRRVLDDICLPVGEEFIATNPDTGEILMCAQLVPIMQQVARDLAFRGDTKWTIERKKQ